MKALGSNGARDKYVILRCEMAHFHGCDDYNVNGFHDYGKILQTVLLIHSYHQVPGFYDYNRPTA